MSVSPIQAMLNGDDAKTRAEKLGDFTDLQIGIDPEDPLLQIPGLTNDLRRIVEAQNRQANNSSIANQKAIREELGNFTEACNGFQSTLADSIARIESAKIPVQKISATPQKQSDFNVTSAAIGASVTIILMSLAGFLFVIPKEVARQRGADWAIAEYLTSPKGKEFRKQFDKCHKAGKAKCKL
jgi:hypothetical protein